MIKLISSPIEFASFCKNDIFYVRIMSLLGAYSTAYSFALFYKQVDENGEITAIISRLDNDYTVCHADEFDLDELSEFFSKLGFNSVLTDAEVVLPFLYDYGSIMKTAKKTEIVMPNVIIDEYPKLMDLFNLDDYGAIDFEAWYVDISHRIRHGFAKAFTLNIDDEIISSGIFSSIYKNNAVLTAVSTQSLFRKSGYATALVSAMLCDVKGAVYLMREKDKNKHFYEKLGFTDCGIWRMYK